MTNDNVMRKKKYVYISSVGCTCNEFFLILYNVRCESYNIYIQEPYKKKKNTK